MQQKKYRFFIDGLRSIRKEGLIPIFKQIKPLWKFSSWKQKLLLFVTVVWTVSPLDDMLMSWTGPGMFADEAVMGLLSTFTLFAVRKSQDYIEAQMARVQALQSTSGNVVDRVSPATAVSPRTESYKLEEPTAQASWIPVGAPVSYKIGPDERKTT